MTRYLKSLAGLTSAPETLVEFRINGVPVSLTLGEIAKWMKDNKLTNETIRDARVNGVPTGIFPVIEAKSQKASEALTGVMKRRTKDQECLVPVGDGWYFKTQSWARDVLNEIMALGVGLEELVLEWQLGQPKGATAKQLELPIGHGSIKPGPIQRRLAEAQLAEDSKAIFG